MTSFDWSVLSASLAGGLALGLMAITALRRHRTRHPDHAQVDSGNRRRRIEVVAINDANAESDGSTKREEVKR